LDAIETHSYAGGFAKIKTPLASCLRFADLLAPSHAWEGMHKFRQVVYRGDIEIAALLQNGWVIEYFQEMDVPLHANLTKYYQVLEKNCG